MRLVLRNNPFGVDLTSLRDGSRSAVAISNMSQFRYIR
jgi:hypothetical protein